MQSSKASHASPPSNVQIGHASVPVQQAHSPPPSGATQPLKPKAHRKFSSDGVQISMFSDLLDNTSSDEMSFDEEDMYGSDPDVETISLGSGSNQVVRSSEEDVVCFLSGQPIKAISCTL